MTIPFNAYIKTSNISDIQIQTATNERARITADGKLVTCLFSNTGMDLKSLLRSRKSNKFITDEIINTWKLRDDKYSLERANSKVNVKNKIEMFQTGG